MKSLSTRGAIGSIPTSSFVVESCRDGLVFAPAIVAQISKVVIYIYISDGQTIKRITYKGVAR